MAVTARVQIIVFFISVFLDCAKVKKTPEKGSDLRHVKKHLPHGMTTGGHNKASDHKRVIFPSVRDNRTDG